MADYEREGVHRPPPQETSDGSDQESGDEMDGGDEGLGGRTSHDIRRHDQDIVEEEEEAEKLLAGGERPRGFFKRRDEDGNPVKISNKERRGYKREARRNRRGSAKEEESELMYEMEEGAHRDSSQSSGSSYEMDRQRMEEMRPQKSKKSRAGVLAGIHVMIAVAFCGLLYGAYKASKSTADARNALLTLSNGTTHFAPTTILISLDGFRADFLQRNITPHLNALVQAGVSPQYMLPSFPSVTFPNHFTLVTGLYPEAHGVVGNTFWDEALQEEFDYGDPARSMQPKWWQGEPVWVTAEDQDVRTAIHMWPGSEAHLGHIEPTYVDKYNGREILSNKVNRILGLLDLPGPDHPTDLPRPQLIAAYVPNVDAYGHLYGPNSTEITTTIMGVDRMLGELFQGLEERNLTNIVNVVVVSDHGMASTDTSRLIQLDDIIDMSLIKHIDGWPLYGLRPKNDKDLEGLYVRLKEEAEKSHGKFEVYLRDNDMPERYHFSRNPRIAPLWIVPQTGWAIVTRKDFDVEAGKQAGTEYHPKGLHGYDHEHPLMRAIFIARGPAFPHTPGSRLDVFQNIEVYNIVCDSLGITPKPNNGTLRLPLKPVGTHDQVPPAEVPEDPATDAVAVNDAGGLSDVSSAPATTPSSPSTGDSASQTLNDEAVQTRPTVQTEEAAPTRPVVQDGHNPDDEDGQEKVNLWWAWVKGKIDGIKNWASGADDKGHNSTTAAAWS